MYVPFSVRIKFSQNINEFLYNDGHNVNNWNLLLVEDSNIITNIDFGFGTGGLLTLYFIGGCGNGAKPIEYFFLGTVYPTRQNFSLYRK